MTYEAEVQFKFDATFTPTYGTSSWTDDDFIPEEHFLITAPAADLNAKQYFKLFEKFMLCVGMDPKSIRSGAMSLVFNDWTNEEEQRKVCKEYELTMNEDLDEKFKQWVKTQKELEEELETIQKFANEPKIKGDFYETL
jgi:predicted ATP-dependent Lon-type protease